MNTCKYCFSAIPDDAAFCPGCGAERADALNKPRRAAAEPAYSEPAYSEPANASGPEPACAPEAAYTAAPAPAYAKDTNGFAIAAFICAFFVPIAGIALSIIAMIQANSNVYAKPLKGLSIWALVISIIGIIVRIALLVAFLSLFSGFFSSLYEYINRLLNGAIPTMIGM